MPKAVNKKKKFIDPKSEKTTTFALIHRSQKDPLAADPDAPQRVLQALPTKDEIKKRKEEERNFGVFFEDEYDYLQHMKGRDEGQTQWLEVDKVDKVVIDNNDKISNLKLPSIVFPSNKEEEIGLLNKAAPIRGPLLDWDPDIVETLDDEFKHEAVYTLKDEDSEDDENDLDMILAEANAEKSESENDDDYDDYDSDEALDDVPSLQGDFDDNMSNFSEEETRSKFTAYSMSSSVIRRNNQLTLLDDKFEKFFDDYDEEKVGGLELEDVEGYQDENSTVMKQMLKDFEHQKAQEKRQNYDENDVKKDILDRQDSDGEVPKEFIEIHDDEEAEDKFDCESILSTYSNLYNHPKLISEPSIKPIRVSGKTGIPKDVLGKGLTSAALKQLDAQNRDENSSDEETMTLASRVSELSFRNKHESKDEKKARKQAVKAFRRERRVERKANKDAFRDEKNKQEKNAMHLRANCNQAIKLV